MYSITKWNDKTNNVIGQLFNDIVKANEYVQKAKRKRKQVYNVDIQTINEPKETPKPETFNMNSIPSEIKTYIETENPDICVTNSIKWKTSSS